MDITTFFGPRFSFVMMSSHYFLFWKGIVKYEYCKVLYVPYYRTYCGPHYSYCTRTFYLLRYFVTLGKSETYKETIKEKIHHITVQYP